MERGLSGVGDDLKQALSGHMLRSTLDKYAMSPSEMVDRTLAARRMNKKDLKNVRIIQRSLVSRKTKTVSKNKMVAEDGFEPPTRGL